MRFACSLRKDQTPGEKVLWKRLRSKRFYGCKFRRQVPFGPYVVDFLCVERKLIIEIDGDSHYELGVQEYDEKRERYLRAHGFEVIRFGNRQTCTAIDDVLAELMHVLEHLSN
ncbi:TPA: endonuclease domain-containing protein [Candidatus Peribacteria bacterium]|nr:endonuclease domain-containing protein [Candidatus Peribacteria bacterium]HAS34365.1 endonuclease domain-containing protein [Candidatus Peribacteria bacterium]